MIVRRFGCLGLSLLLTACARGQTASSTPHSPGSEGESAGAVQVPTLPPPLVGTFVPTDGATSGRVLIVSEDMLATIECAECGLPSSVRLNAIACTSAEDCEVGGEGCRGRLHRREGTLSVSMRGDGEAAPICARFEGTFVPGEMIGSAGQVIATADAPAGHVVVGEIHSPRAIDLDGARRVIDGRVAELDQCYQVALIDAPTLAGRLVIEVVHGSRGVSKAPARVHESSFEHPSVGGCLEAALRDLDYPLAADGLPAPVYYTIELVPR